MAAQHLDEQAGDGQVRPLHVGRDVDQQQPAAAPALGGDQRRAVGQPRPAPVGQGEGGFRQHLAAHPDVARDAEAEERRPLGERRDPRRARPGQRAAERAPALAEGDRQQLAAALGQSRPGEAQQDAAALDPRRQPVRVGAGELADVGKDDHGEPAFPSTRRRRRASGSRRGARPAPDNRTRSAAAGRTRTIRRTPRPRAAAASARRGGTTPPAVRWPSTRIRAASLRSAPGRASRTPARPPRRPRTPPRPARGPGRRDRRRAPRPPAGPNRRPGARPRRGRADRPPAGRGAAGRARPRRPSRRGSRGPASARRGRRPVRRGGRRTTRPHGREPSTSAESTASRTAR